MLLKGLSSLCHRRSTCLLCLHVCLLSFFLSVSLCVCLFFVWKHLHISGRLGAGRHLTRNCSPTEPNHACRSSLHRLPLNAPWGAWGERAFRCAVHCVYCCIDNKHLELHWMIWIIIRHLGQTFIMVWSGNCQRWNIEWSLAVLLWIAALKNRVVLKDHRVFVFH